MNDTIRHLLSNQQEQLELLLSLLKKEYSVLSERQIDQLEQLLPEKQQCADKVAELDQQLSQADELSDLKTQKWFIEQVAELQQLMGECQQQTRVNQQVVEQSQLVIARLKSELLQSRGRSGLTYTAKGKPAINDKGPGIKA
ncbi:flagellar export chaperone FlgN [Rheinheimera marina]|uniref:Flagellar export chaperone FlgN n=1 Tax=Rheinheimera marina TaxID=1774958 RepID=A0ABV9JRR4_9GAMM